MPQPADPSGYATQAGARGLSRHTTETRAGTGHRVGVSTARAHCSHGCHRALTCAPKPGIRYPRQWIRAGSGSFLHGESHSRAGHLRASNNCRTKNAFRLNTRRRPGSNAVVRWSASQSRFPATPDPHGSELPPGGAGAPRSHDSTHSQHAERYGSSRRCWSTRGSGMPEKGRCGLLVMHSSPLTRKAILDPFRGDPGVTVLGGCPHPTAVGSLPGRRVCAAIWRTGAVPGPSSTAGTTPPARASSSPPPSAYPSTADTAGKGGIVQGREHGTEMGPPHRAARQVPPVGFAGVRTAGEGPAGTGEHQCARHILTPLRQLPEHIG